MFLYWNRDRITDPHFSRGMRNVFQHGIAFRRHLSGENWEKTAFGTHSGLGFGEGGALFPTRILAMSMLECAIVLYNREHCQRIDCRISESLAQEHIGAHIVHLKKCVGEVTLKSLMHYYMTNKESFKFTNILDRSTDLYCAPFQKVFALIDAHISNAIGTSGMDLIRDMILKPSGMNETYSFKESPLSEGEVESYTSTFHRQCVVEIAHTCASVEAMNGTTAKDLEIFSELLLCQGIDVSWIDYRKLIYFFRDVNLAAKYCPIGDLIYKSYSSYTEGEILLLSPSDFVRYVGLLADVLQNASEGEFSKNLRSTSLFSEVSYKLGIGRKLRVPTYALRENCLHRGLSMSCCITPDFMGGCVSMFEVPGHARGKHTLN